MVIGHDAAKNIVKDGATIKLFVSAKKDVLSLTKVGYDDYRATERFQE
jgi:hypothetical protein